MDIKNVSPAIQGMMREDNTTYGKPKSAMGKDEFLKLLLAQMQNQDPLKPLENHEFVAQLAQFSSLEQLTNIGSGIQNLKTGLGENAKLQALTMMGKQVLAGTQEVDITEGESVTIPFKPNPELKPEKAQIINMQGKMVRELDISQNVGTDFVWDGKSSDGKFAETGHYSFRVMGSDSKGQFRDMTAEVSGKVVGMQMNGQTAVLEVQTAGGVVKLDMNKVRSIQEEGANTASAAPANAAHKPVVKTAATATVPPTVKLNTPDVVAALEDAEPAEAPEPPEPEEKPEGMPAIDPAALSSFFENNIKGR